MKWQDHHSHNKIVLQTQLQLHSCCMMTCAITGSGHDTLPRDHHHVRNGHPQQVQLPLPTLPPKPPVTILCGMRGSDIDKYSRVIFPIMFVSFHMMYWMIYLSISGEIPDDVVPLNE